MIWEVLDPLQETDWLSVINEEITPSGAVGPRRTRRLTAEQERRLDEIEIEAKQARTEPPSPIYRALIGSATAIRLKLTDVQIGIVKDLDDVVRGGLAFITLQSADGAVTAKGARAKRLKQATDEQRQSFVEHAEQVALEGILTSEQAEELKRILEQR